MTSLAKTALRSLQADFNDWGLAVEGEQEEAIKSYLSILEQGLLGELDDKFYLLSLDPGMGKTSASMAFIKAWRDAGFQPASSILVGIFTLAELQSFIDGAGLEREDFGVLTGDDEMNRLGLPEDRHSEAKVLFTTQAMIRSRTRGRAFADASAFNFQGLPRSLRLWDEDILPSTWRTVRLDDLAALPAPLRPRFPDLAKLLTEFCEKVMKTQVGQTICVPEAFRLSHQTFSGACSEVGFERHKTTLETVQLMAGSEMLVQAGDYFGKELVGVRTVLPDDLAPLIVVDASGRVRDAYKSLIRN